MTSINNLDNHIQGDFDPNAPFNQPDSEPQINEIWECLDAENYNRAYELLSEIRKEVNQLREYAKANENQYLLKRLNLIYGKL